ncbi:alpha/beta hydrolase [Streptomyces sp. NPDC051018]|uniref:alpha/beta hydrolase n=1 Tax=Streptomyces sp. NPDC051018 TaxID=3365639 RepID=UPI0037888DF1
MRISGFPPARRHYTAAALAAAVICSTVFAEPYFAPAGGRPAPAGPVPRLNWRPCSAGSPFDCATATVPLDYADPGGRTIDLAVIKRKATGPGRRIGTLFFNPGGPGGPGTVQMPDRYEFFPREVRERFDIVSWDPRGIGNSTAVRCFDTPEAADVWASGKPAGFPVGEQQRAAWIAAYAELGRLCEKRDPELLRHVSTADTARDLDGLRQAVGEPQLNYLGTSYGSFLGATYANLFPGKVRAMTLDSNIDPRAWTDNGSDIDPALPTFLRMGTDVGAAEVLDRFLTLCGSTTTDRCAFSAGSPKATRDKFDRLMRRLRDRPVGAWTYAKTVADTVNGLYTVHPGWTELAGRLQELWRGRVPGPPPPSTSPVPVPVPYLGEEQAGAVFCSDSPNPQDVEVYHRAEEIAAARAGDAGRFWAWASEPCATWPARPANRYTGPWDRLTSPTVLVVNPLYDPATAYPNAQAMVRELVNARLLTLNGYGHTALGNPSSCVQEYESRYFIDGTLPPAGTVCDQDTAPFPSPGPPGGQDAPAVRPVVPGAVS